MGWGKPPQSTGTFWSLWAPRPFLARYPYPTCPKYTREQKIISRAELIYCEEKEQRSSQNVLENPGISLKALWSSIRGQAGRKLDSTTVFINPPLESAAARQSWRLSHVFICISCREYGKGWDRCHSTLIFTVGVCAVAILFCGWLHLPRKPFCGFAHHAASEFQRVPIGWKGLGDPCLKEF